MNKWDKKAKNYSRYSDSDDTLESMICQHISDMDIDFSDKSVLDIGCGTGVYTLRVAQKASRVDALDFSKGMLEVLELDAEDLGIDNIQLHHSTWDDYKLPSHKYDIALCTMSPALKIAKDYEKMTLSAKTKIYLGWGGKRGADLMEQLFNAHDATYMPPDGATKLIEWLEYNDMPYRVTPHIEEKVRIKVFDKAVENFEWHLEGRGVTPDRDKVKKILEKFCDKEGLVTERTMNYLELIVW